LKSVIRKAKKSKRKVSKAQKIACQWQIYITSISDDLCTQEEVITLYSVRWQIELIFKLWKSGLKFDESNGKTTERVLCEKLLKMIYLLIYHSIAVLANIVPVCERSHIQALNLFKLKAKDLLFLLPDNPEKLNKYILKTVKDISEIPKRSKRKKCPSTYDRPKNDTINNHLYVNS